MIGDDLAARLSALEARERARDALLDCVAVGLLNGGFNGPAVENALNAFRLARDATAPSPPVAEGEVRTPRLVALMDGHPIPTPGPSARIDCARRALAPAPAAEGE